MDNNDSKPLGVDQIERLMWGAFWDCVHDDKDFRDLAMPGEVMCAMADRVHEYLPGGTKRKELESDLSAARDQLAEMREALEWLVNLHHGQSKGGDEYSPPSSMEWRAAIDAGKEVLAAAPAGGRVIARWIGQVKAKGGPAVPDIHFDDRDNSLAIYLPEDCDAFVGQVLSIKLEEYTDEKST